MRIINTFNRGFCDFDPLVLSLGDRRCLACKYRLLFNPFAASTINRNSAYSTVVIISTTERKINCDVIYNSQKYVSVPFSAIIASTGNVWERTSPQATWFLFTNVPAASATSRRQNNIYVSTYTIPWIDNNSCNAWTHLAYKWRWYVLLWTIYFAWATKAPAVSKSISLARYKRALMVYFKHIHTHRPRLHHALPITCDDFPSFFSLNALALRVGASARHTILMRIAITKKKIQAYAINIRSFYCAWIFIIQARTCAPIPFFFVTIIAEDFTRWLVFYVGHRHDEIVLFDY